MKKLRIFALALIFIITASFSIKYFAPPKVNDYIENVVDNIISSNEDRFPNMPEEYYSHALIPYRDRGSCRKLCGNISMTFIFMDEKNSSWNQSDTQAFRDKILETSAKLKAEALNYGSELEINEYFYSGKIEEEVDMKNSESWYEKALKSAGFDSEKQFSDIDDDIESPVFFCINRAGRSYAQSASLKKSFEYSVLYNTDADYRHEMLHLFGAVDYYIEDSIIAASDKYFPHSLMKETTEEANIDELTAYLAGLTDELSENALAFLSETLKVTDKSISEARDDSVFTGNKSKRLGDGEYTGNFIEGIPNGKGSILWDNGDKYDGDWENGVMHGKGTLIWANGDTYTGDWVDGMRTGQGEYKYASGNVYTGEFSDGTISGYGIMVWADGEKYEGYWADGIMNGQGTYTYSNGSYYTGDFVNGKMQGTGTMVWSSGEKYEGAWENSDFNGYGTYYFSNGKTKSGYWHDGEIYN